MTYKIQDIESIGPSYASKLEKADITTVEALLDKGATKSGRKNIASASGIDESRILDWVNMADLFRIKGVAGEIAELMKKSGVDTIKELRNRNPASLHDKMVEVNGVKKVSRTVPSTSQIEGFIDQAKAMEPKITY